MIAFVEDVAASGGYMIACAADEIVADPSSIVGSIGVIGASFGFAKLIDKIGIERRIYTSGTNKAMLDPFLPENPEHVARLKAIQEDIHASLHRAGEVAPRRQADRRRTGICSPANTGRRARAWNTAWSTASAICVRPCASAMATRSRRRWSRRRRSLFGRTTPGVSAGIERLLDRPGLTDELISSLEARAIWARYGL